MKQVILATLGGICIIFGAIGLFLPLWPTTPFVLLAAACFSCMPKQRETLLRIPFVKDHLENYQNRTGIPRKTLVINLVFLWGMLLISSVMVQKIWITVLLFAIGTAVTIHLVVMAKPKQEKRSKEKRGMVNDGSSH